MKHPKHSTLFIIFFLGLLTAQTPYNAVSLGSFFDGADGVGTGLASSGLVTDGNLFYSPNNPTTWPASKFTRLSICYSGGELTYPNTGMKNGFGGSTQTVMSVPIAEKFAWGLGIKPLTRKNFILSDDSTTTFYDTTSFNNDTLGNIISDVKRNGNWVELPGEYNFGIEPTPGLTYEIDTLEVPKTVSGKGGLNSLFTAFAWKLNQTNTVSFQLDFLYGIVDEKTEAEFFGLIVYERLFQFKGTLFTLNWTSIQLLQKFDLSFFMSYQFPIGNQKITETRYHPYWNSAIEGTQEEVIVHNQFSYPSTLSTGFTYKINPNILFYGESVIRIFKQNDVLNLMSSIDADVKNEYRISGGLVLTGERKSRNLFKKLNYRIGTFYRQYYIFRPDSPLIEKGLSAGFGIPFGAADNQIDVEYRYSIKDGFLSTESEINQTLSVGITLGDLWLMKKKRR